MNRDSTGNRGLSHPPQEPNRGRSVPMNRRDAIKHGALVAAGLASGTLVRTAPSQDQEALQEPEILIRGGRVVNADGSRQADVLIRGERIASVGSSLTVGPGARLIDASNHLVMPGGIDPHTHFGGGFVDDFTSGTAAAVAGGITTVGTFAFTAVEENALEAMDRSLAEVTRDAIADVFVHVSNWPPTRGEFAEMMPDLAARGQPSHKVFMTPDDFDRNRGALIQLMEAARESGVITLLHCEDGAILNAVRRRMREEGRTSLAHYAESRPVIAEVAATEDAVALCELTGAPVHLVHLSSERALNAARDPIAAGLPLTIETRPIYLYFTEERLWGPDGPLYIGQPPLRQAGDVEALWQGLADGRIDMLATDHAPWTRAQKLDPELSIERTRPGMSDLLFLRPVLFSEGVVKGRISEERFVEVTATAAARTFGLYPERGVLREGSLADVAIVDPQLERVVDTADDPSNADYTLFQGWPVRGWPVITIRRGEVVYEDGRVTGQPGSGRPVLRRPWPA